ncbi:hypothetical protein BDQ94DRAFT_30690 [Aspergillus welwitschiae]|uniref:Secreted protein n=1 Tax=Aspergillus welwitschiae TaxID=1341132 RepID=A0A3F3Q366_9EURO|nr:hypothetical protein BDQ94DRAFT_30690 [Aspergillus welwitschiae]RDH33535.1 hypothetical protein BDQ94DRAFT_30690 [Aspergillus welwitschiae]
MRLSGCWTLAFSTTFGFPFQGTVTYTPYSHTPYSTTCSLVVVGVTAAPPPRTVTFIHQPSARRHGSWGVFSTASVPHAVTRSTHLSISLHLLPIRVTIIHLSSRRGCFSFISAFSIHPFTPSRPESKTPRNLV